MKILICGLPGSGKTTLAIKLSAELGCVHFNADEIRKHINKDLGFTVADREEQARRMGILCDIVLKSQGIVIADFVCPTKRTREIFNPDLIIYMNTIQSGRFEDTNKIFEPPVISPNLLAIDRFDRADDLSLNFIYNSIHAADLL